MWSMLPILNGNPLPQAMVWILYYVYNNLFFPSHQQYEIFETPLSIKENELSIFLKLENCFESFEGWLSLELLPSLELKFHSGVSFRIHVQSGHTTGKFDIGYLEQRIKTAIHSGRRNQFYFPNLWTVDQREPILPCLGWSYLVGIPLYFLINAVFA